MSAAHRHVDLLDRLRQWLDSAALQPGPPRVCSYLPEQMAQDAAFSTGRIPPGVYHAFMDLNFRRSGRTLYRPACPTCTQCRAIRIPVADFRPDRSQQRCLRRNQDLTVEIGLPVPSRSKHALYARYLWTRHGGEMSDDWDDFCRFLYESPVRTLELTYLLGSRVMGAGILDVEPSAISTVYFYYDPEAAPRSLGTFNILRTIQECRTRGMEWLYLGFYVADSRKMNYKTRFRPCEVLAVDGSWHRIGPSNGIGAS